MSFVIRTIIVGRTFYVMYIAFFFFWFRIDDYLRGYGIFLCLTHLLVNWLAQ
jgi:hypothetical protein